MRYNATTTYYWRFDDVLDPRDCYHGENLSSEYFVNNSHLLEPTAALTCTYPNYGTAGSFFNLGNGDEGGGGGGGGGDGDADDVPRISWGKEGRGLVYDADVKMCTFMGNFTWAKHVCILDPTECRVGFSVAMWVNITWQDFINGSISTFISTGKFVLFIKIFSHYINIHFTLITLTFISLPLH